MAACCDYACLVDVGPTKAKAVHDAGTKLLGYVKASGVRGPESVAGTDAEYAAAKAAGLLWTRADGSPVLQADNRWTYTRVQDRPEDCYRVIVKPRIEAMLTSAPGCYAGVLVDNTTWQDPSLFAGGVPADFDAKAFHDGCLGILSLIKRDFPDLIRAANGICGGAPAGLRGEAFAMPGYADLVWIEGIRFKASGKRQTDARFQADLGLVIGLANAGRTIIWDELSKKVGELDFAESLSAAFAARSRVTGSGSIVVASSGAPWGVDWVRTA
jgi:hypothetical protein